MIWCISLIGLCIRQRLCGKKLQRLSDSGRSCKVFVKRTGEIRSLRQGSSWICVDANTNTSFYHVVAVL